MQHTAQSNISNYDADLRINEADMVQSLDQSRSSVPISDQGS